VLEQYTPGDEHAFQEHAKESVPERFAEFGSTYQTIALETYSKKTEVNSK